MRDLPLSELIVKRAGYSNMKDGYAVFYAPANLIEQVRGLERKIAELERSYDVLAEEKLDKLVSHKKRVAELEEKIEEYESAIRVYDEVYDEIKHELTKVREALKTLSTDSIGKHQDTYDLIAKQALEKEAKVDLRDDI